MSSLGMSLRRYGAAFAFAATTTGSLLLLMQHLIQPDDVAVKEPIPPTTFEIGPIIDEPDPTPRPKVPEPPKVTPPPELALVTQHDPVAGEWGGEFQPPKKPSGKFRVRLDRADGGLLPIAQVVPNYPERAKRSGIEGYVVVEFTVDTTGAVRDAVVVEAHPTGIFDRAALNAVLRSKYRPRIEGGQAQVVQGVLKRVSFNLKS